MNRSLSRFERVNQWLQFSRQWHLIDADHQDVNNLALKVARHLKGAHKPIYHPMSDCGDHVVVINCRGISMHAFDWKNRHFFYNNEFPKGRAQYPLFSIHEYDPCRILFTMVYKVMGHRLLGRKHVARLHLFPDEDIPEFVRKNLGNQLSQIQVIPKRSDEYTEEERKAFPRLLKFPEDHVLDWERPVKPPEKHILPNPYEKKKNQ